MAGCGHKCGHEASSRHEPEARLGSCHNHEDGRSVPEPLLGTRNAEDGGIACQLELQSAVPGNTDEQVRFARLEKSLHGIAGVQEVHLRKDGLNPEVCIHYDPQKIPLSVLSETLDSVKGQISKRYRLHSWLISGMESAQCGYLIEHTLQHMPGVLTADVAYASERLVVEYDNEVVKPRLIAARIKDLGYELEEPEKGHVCSFHAGDDSLAAKLELPLVVFSGLLLAASFVWQHFIDPSNTALALALAGIAMLSAGFFPLQVAFNAVRNGVWDIESLMVLAAIAAGCLGAWFEGAFLLFLFSLGHALEHRAMEKARKAVEELGKLRPETALLKKGDTLVETPVNQVQPGDIMMIRPGDRVPCDGIIISGTSLLDQSTITGESVPVVRGPEEQVFAGTINTEATLEVKITKLPTESVLSRIIDMVSEAEAQKGPSQRFAQKLERTFVPLVLFAAPALALALLLLGFDLKAAILRGISLLVAASPCALAIATPAAVLAAVARAARSGVLIKGGAHLEALGRVEAIAFDKTGTLTTGKPSLVAIEPEAGVSETDLLYAAAVAETHSTHPLAKAVIQGAKERNIQPGMPKSMDVIPGKGIKAYVDNSQIWLGSPALFADVSLPQSIKDKVLRLEQSGQTIMIVRLDEQYLGVIGVADELRPEARAVLAELKRLGISRSVMLSGDNEVVAKAIGARVDIDEARAGLMPADKVRILRSLSRQGGVAMVGDGVNDAPALSAASVGIAIGGTGADVALETADLVLMSHGLERLPFAVELSRTAAATIQQNMFIALSVSAMLILAAIFGWVNISNAVILHEGSTLVVLLNGLRLLRFRGRGTI